MLRVAGGIDIELLRIEILRCLAYYMIIEDELDGELWYRDILNYLQNGKFS